MPNGIDLEEQGIAIIPSLATALRARCEAKPNRPGIDVVVDLAVVIANADGSIDESEMDALAKTLHALIGEGLTPEHIRLEISASLQTVRSEGNLNYGRTLGKSLSSLKAGEEGLRLAAAIAYASRGLDPEERAVLEAIAETAGVSKDRLEIILQETQTAFDSI